MDDALTDDAIAGGLRVWQRRRGHRYSLDDVMTAREAARAVPEPRQCLDLGCGIASVLLMLAYKNPRTSFVGIEAQRESYELACRNVERNGLSSRTRIELGDIRELSTTHARTFDLVTGTPPYKPPGSGTASPDPQRAFARIEMRGGVEAYLRAASSALAPNGRAVVCADATTPDRVLDAAVAAELAPIRRIDVVPRENHKVALFTVWTFVHANGSTSALQTAPPFIARDAFGARTADANALRRFFDLPVNEAEPASP